MHLFSNQKKIFLSLIYTKLSQFAISTKFWRSLVLSCISLSQLTKYYIKASYAFSPGLANTKGVFPKLNVSAFTTKLVQLRNYNLAIFCSVRVAFLRKQVSSVVLENSTNQSISQKFSFAWINKCDKWGQLIECLVLLRWYSFQIK